MVRFGHIDRFEQPPIKQRSEKDHHDRDADARSWESAAAARLRRFFATVQPVGRPQPTHRGATRRRPAPFGRRQRRLVGSLSKSLALRLS